MGEVVDLMPRIRARDFEAFWLDAVEGKPGSVERLRNLMRLDYEFRAFCEAKYKQHIAARTAEDDGA